MVYWPPFYLTLGVLSSFPLVQDTLKVASAAHAYIIQMFIFGNILKLWAFFFKAMGWFYVAVGKAIRAAYFSFLPQGKERT